MCLKFQKTSYMHMAGETLLLPYAKVSTLLHSHVDGVAVC